MQRSFGEPYPTINTSELKFVAPEPLSRQSRQRRAPVRPSLVNSIAGGVTPFIPNLPTKPIANHIPIPLIAIRKEAIRYAPGCARVRAKIKAHTQGISIGEVKSGHAIAGLVGCMALVGENGQRVGVGPRDTDTRDGVPFIRVRGEIIVRAGGKEGRATVVTLSHAGDIKFCPSLGASQLAVLSDALELSMHSGQGYIFHVGRLSR